MTLEQKAEEYVKNNCCEFCVNLDDCKLGCIDCHTKEGYIKGYEEGQKNEIHFLENIEIKILEKENAELKEQIDKLKVCGSCKYVTHSAHEEPCIHCAKCFICTDKSVNKWELDE